MECTECTREPDHHSAARLSASQLKTHTQTHEEPSWNKLKRQQETAKDKTIRLIDWADRCKVRDGMIDGAVNGKALKGKVTPGRAPSA